MLEKSFDVKLPGRTIKCSSYNLNDFIKLNLSKTVDGSELLKRTYSDIIHKCTNGEVMNKHESEFALIHIIAKSEHEDSVLVEYTCECGDISNVNLNLDHISIDGIDSNLQLKLKTFNISFNWPNLWADDDIAKMIVDSIDAIYVGSERIELDDLSETELNDLYTAISEEHINYIKKMLLAPTPVLGVPIKCKSCGKSHIKKISGFKEFIEIL